jgi:methyl-accepting chemotaxis protein
VEQVTTAVNDLNNGARENASGISQTRASIQGLKEAAMSLKRLVGGQSSA